MANLKDYQKEVEKLMAEENWSKAYEICNKILGYDPENTTFIKLKSSIEKQVKQINSKAISDELNNYNHLIHEKKYEEYLKAVAPLQAYIKQFPEIGTKIINVKKLLDDEYFQKREQAYRELIKDIHAIKGEFNYAETVNKLENFVKLGIHKNDIQNLIKKIKSRHVNNEIEKNSGLINSQKYEDILLFLLKLKKIDKENSQINNLIKKVNTAYKEFKIESKKDYIFKTLEEIKTLYLTKKFDYCVELSERILGIDGNNQLANQYLKKATIKSNDESEKKIINSIYQNYSDFPKSKAFENRNFIKI